MPSHGKYFPPAWNTLRRSAKRQQSSFQPASYAARSSRDRVAAYPARVKIFSLSAPAAESAQSSAERPKFCQYWKYAAMATASECPRRQQHRNPEMLRLHYIVHGSQYLQCRCPKYLLPCEHARINTPPGTNIAGVFRRNDAGGLYL